MSMDIKENNNIKATSGNSISDNGPGCEIVDAYCFGKHDKEREGGVGAFSVTLILSGVREHFTEAYKTEMDTINLKVLAMTEVFKLCFEREIKQLNLYYDDERLKNWCVGMLESNSLNLHNLKTQYDKFNNFGEVNFIKVNGQQPDYYRGTIKRTMESIYRVR